MIEVEVKAKINDFNKIKKKLNELNAIKLKSEFQMDLYFNSPIVDYAKTDEALRIRKTESNDETNIFITYKGPKLDKTSKTRKEIEMKIENENKAKDILESIGFKEVKTVEKNREYYEYKEFEICLDSAKGLDYYMEIELSLEENSNYENAQNKIFQLFKILGIESGFERRSYLELLENKS